MSRLSVNCVPFYALILFFATLSPLQAGGWLGVTVEPPHGVQIGEIIKGGPADRAKLENGDIIQSIDQQPVDSLHSFVRDISRLGAGKQVVLGIVRQGKKQEVRVTLDDSNDHPSVSQTPFYRLPGSNHLASPPTSQLGSLIPPAPELLEQGYPSPHALPSPPERQPFPSHPTVWLGIAPGMAEDGVLVKGVAPQSPGEQAGIRTGDLIIAINGQAVSTPASLVRMMRQFKPDDLVLIGLNSQGETKTVQAIMALHPASQ
ncbi:MAG: PDZ domain-containing protein [Magnetococcales bacterium]|nr:PDZ domain-containing protein [Magnetococcales bacterium]